MNPATEPPRLGRDYPQITQIPQIPVPDLGFRIWSFEFPKVPGGEPLNPDLR